MFGIGIPELIVIMIIALIVIGPEKLPDIAKTLGKALSEFKNVVDGVKTSMEEEQRSIEKGLADKPEQSYSMRLGDKEEELRKDYEEAFAEEESEAGKASTVSGKEPQKRKKSAPRDSGNAKKTVKKEAVKKA